MAHVPITEEAHLNGDILYGDDFDELAIAQWYEIEERGYYDLANSQLVDPQESANYGYHGLNAHHGLRHLHDRKFPTCLALGCGSGADLEPLAAFVDAFYCIEPAKSWWKDEIAGKPATFVSPSLTGKVKLEAGSIDLAVSFGVLHHIPNVTSVLAEIIRVMKPGGLLILREPISWMGDWRRKRPGLTPNERGLPLPYLKKTAHALNLRAISSSLCMFTPLVQITKPLGIKGRYNRPWFVWLDALISNLLAFNARYRRETTISKLAAGSIFVVYEKGASLENSAS
ncbi:class I SAM-dependent methyltransferase [Mesorhizobium escarrei]|uniref:Methyltransf_11 domain-containing protein n=1 Tax=Mesorhizobium escarrei TaxID=666018 RepID=A0ABM9ECH7_9HYPH|nr:class I SAM-dependent methyltransferase [Mesorhizobium escarrei]CAH2406496.1 Methyltransf_11 domain-containing protein [Mesorhizobium escarrei]